MSRFWNWKSAVLSALLRSPLFVIAALKTGTAAAVAAGLTDAAFRLAMAGIAGAMIQRLAQMSPRWVATTGALVGVPLLAQAAEALVHYEAATADWPDAFRASVLVSVASALFNLYAMRRGALLTGKASSPLADDLRRLPSLVVGFLRQPFAA
jgi:hypothetical protein